MMRPSVGTPFEMALPQGALRMRIAGYFDPTGESEAVLVRKLRGAREELAVHLAVLRPPRSAAYGSPTQQYASLCISVLRAMIGQLEDALAEDAYAVMAQHEGSRKRRADFGGDLEAAFKRVRL